MSPDGSTVAFVSGGDIWEAPSRGGVGDHRLANEVRHTRAPATAKPAHRPGAGYGTTVTVPFIVG